MKTEIKLRAYVKDLNLMIENFALYPGGMIGIDEDEFVNQISPDFKLYDGEVLDKAGEIVMIILPGDEWIWLEESQVVISQYIGVKTVKGEEVFTGDIIECFRASDREKEEPLQGEIIFLNGCYMTRNATMHEFFRLYQSDFRIVGNVYQNPQLQPQ
jgi:hypothetical protein